MKRKATSWPGYPVEHITLGFCLGSTAEGILLSPETWWVHVILLLIGGGLWWMTLFPREDRNEEEKEPDDSQTEEARRQAEEVTARDAKDRARSHASSARLHRIGKRYDAAAEEYTKAIALDPSLEHYRQRAAVYAEAGRRLDYLADLETLIRLSPADCGGYSLLAREKTGSPVYRGPRDAAGLDVLNRCIAANPSDPAAHRERAAYLNHFPSLAVDDLNRAADLDHGDADTYLRRAAVQEALNLPTEADADYDRAVELRPDRSDVLEARAEFHQRRGRHTQAMADWSRALHGRGSSASRSALIGRGRCYLAMESYEEAVADFTAVVSQTRSPADVSGECWPLRASGLYRLGRHREAAEDWLRAIQGHPQQDAAERIDCLRRLIWVLASSPDDSARDGRRALLYARRLGVEVPEDRRTWQDLVVLAAMLAENGFHEEAARQQEQAVSLGIWPGGREEVRRELEERAVLYRSGKPYRDTRSRGIEHESVLWNIAAPTATVTTAPTGGATSTTSATTMSATVVDPFVGEQERLRAEGHAEIDADPALEENVRLVMHAELDRDVDAIIEEHRRNNP